MINQYIIQVRQAQHSGEITIEGEAEALVVLVKAIQAALVGGPGCEVMFPPNPLRMRVTVLTQEGQGGDGGEG